MNIRPYVICSFDFTERDGAMGHGPPEPLFGWFTDECDNWGKHTFIHLSDIKEAFELEVSFEDGVLSVGNLPHYRKLYLFEAEIGEVHYADRDVLTAAESPCPR